ncbi:hypothetical protein G3I51_24070 [Streptomyces sp. SID9944]|nr:hypothetical protein [Streptomyces sp. SID9944]
MRSDDILSQIDHALDDWTVSDDAMRSRPEGDGGGINGFVPRVQIPDEFAEAWAAFAERVAQAEAERAAHVRAVMEALGRAMKPVAKAAQQAAANLAQAVQQGRPAPSGRRLDRPAWQSPYGPARRR